MSVAQARQGHMNILQGVPGNFAQESDLIELDQKQRIFEDVII